ncbi:MAG: hypothetical protein IJD83_04770, partial [Clostridia bacterium]|nr:hypothetical protein [Clostridia bacterium]
PGRKKQRGYGALRVFARRNSLARYVTKHFRAENALYFEFKTARKEIVNGWQKNAPNLQNHSKTRS